MSPFTRVLSWMAAIGTRGAARNAWRAVEERADAEAAVDALSARLAATTPPAAPRAAPSRAA